MFVCVCVLACAQMSFVWGISDGYSILDIMYVFPTDGSVTQSTSELPQFVLQKIINTNRTEKLSSGEYSRLSLFFLFKRNIGFYIIQIYLPSILIVVISWVSFWLSRDATPARVALGVTTVLTMTTLMTTTNSSMPKVSYVKSIDIFLGVCFMMVFCSLLEYAAVGYINKRLKLVRERKESRLPLLSNCSPMGEHKEHRAQSVPNFVNSNGYRPFYSSTDRKSNLYIPVAQRVPTLAARDDYTEESTSDEVRSRTSVVVIQPRQTAERCPCHVTARCIRPSNIDKYSRSIFPSVFLMFNIGYWTYFIRISQLEEDKMNSMPL